MKEYHFIQNNIDITQFLANREKLLLIFSEATILKAMDFKNFEMESAASYGGSFTEVSILYCISFTSLFFLDNFSWAESSSLPRTAYSMCPAR